MGRQVYPEPRRGSVLATERDFGAARFGLVSHTRSNDVEVFARNAVRVAHSPDLREVVTC